MASYVVLGDRLVAYEVVPRGLTGYATFDAFAQAGREWQGKTLVALYNNAATEQGLGTVRKFTDRETALKRCWDVAQALPVQPRASKKDTVLSLVQRTGGATLEELMGATGWQAHSVRGFLSTNRKHYDILLVERTGETKAYIATKKPNE